MDSIQLKTKELQSKMYLTQTHVLQTHWRIGLINWAASKWLSARQIFFTANQQLTTGN